MQSDNKITSYAYSSWTLLHVSSINSHRQGNVRTFYHRTSHNIHIIAFKPAFLYILYIFYIFNNVHARSGSRDSVVGIATRYGLEGPGIESRLGEIFRTYPDRLRAPPSLLYNGYRVFPGGKGGRGVMLITHPLLVPRLRKS
jgi:hypothetical protein